MRATCDRSELYDEEQKQKKTSSPQICYLPSLWLFNGRMPFMARIVHSLSIITTGSIIEISLATFLSRLEKELPVGVLAIFGPYCGCGMIASVGAASCVNR